MSDFLGTIFSWLIERWPMVVGTGSAMTFVIALYEQILRIKEAQRKLAVADSGNESNELVRKPTSEEITRYGKPIHKTMS